MPGVFFYYRLGVKRDTLVAVDDPGGAILMLARDSTAVGQMDVPVQHQLGVVAVQQLMKNREPTVRQVVQVTVAVHRRVGDKHVKPAVAVNLAAQAVDALAHFSLGKLPVR